MTQAVPQRTGVEETYSAEIERLRRLELRTGGSPAILASDWVPFIYDTSFAAAWFRIHFGCVFFYGQLIGSQSADPDNPGWQLAGALPDYARPPQEHVVHAVWFPRFDFGVTPTSPQMQLVPVRVLQDGRVLHPSSYYHSTTVFVPPFTCCPFRSFGHFETIWNYSPGVARFDLPSSYFPLG